MGGWGEGGPGKFSYIYNQIKSKQYQTGKFENCASKIMKCNRKYIGDNKIVHLMSWLHSESFLS